MFAKCKFQHFMYFKIISKILLLNFTTNYCKILRTTTLRRGQIKDFVNEYDDNDDDHDNDYDNNDCDYNNNNNDDNDNY